MGFDIKLTVPQAHVDWLKKRIAKESPITLPISLYPSTTTLKKMQKRIFWHSCQKVS